MYKRIFSLVLSLLIVISLVPSAIATEKSEVDYNSAHVDMVADLGIMQKLDNGRFLGDINLKWNEFSHILKQFGFNPAEHENTEVTVKEIAEHFVFIAGYENFVKVSAFSQAASWGIFKGLNVTPESKVTRYQMASIIAEFMEVEPVLEASTLDYNLNSGVTVMSEILGLEKITGIVTDNGYSALKGESKVNPYTIVIDDKYSLYIDISKYDVSNYLGHNVDILYSTKQDTSLEVFYIGYNHKDEVLKIESSDIISISKNSVSYYVNDKKKTRTFSSELTCIKNGEYLLSYTKEDLNPEIGYIEIIDNGSGTDIISVRSFTDYIVSGVLIVNGVYTIYSMCQTNDKNDFIKIDENDKNVIIKSKKGTKLTIKDITEGKILTVAQSNVYTEIIISENVVTNFEFESISYDSQEGWTLKSMIGMEFKVTDTYMEKDDELKKALRGDNGTLYLNAFGDVAYYEATLRTDVSYGCLVGVHYDADEDIVIVKILTEDGTKHIFNVTDKITITDDVAVTQRYVPERVYAKLYGKNEIVRFTVSTKGELREIVMFPYIEEFVKAGDMRKIYEGNVTYNSDYKNFGKFVDRNTVYFIVDSEDKHNIDKYAVFNDTLKLRGGASYEAKGYGTKNSYADYVILYDLDENNLSPRATSKFGVVIKTGTKYDEQEGEALPYVVYNVDGTEEEIICEDADVIEKAYDCYTKIPSENATRYQVKRGDIVRFYTHPVTGKAQACTILFSTSVKNPSFPESTFGFIPGAEIGAHDGVSTKCNPFGITGSFVASTALTATSGYNNRIMLGWVYDNFDSTIEVTNQDLSIGKYEGITFDGGGIEGWSTEMPSVKTSPVIIEYHDGKLENVRIGSIDDIRNYKDFSNDCSAYLTVYRQYAGMMQSYIINHTK